MLGSDYPIIYWDTSAILSFLFEDQHTHEARQYVENNGRVHLISSLAWAEALAVISRLRREKALDMPLIKQAISTIEFGPWRRVNAWPEWKMLKRLAAKWPLRGADLWHLGTAITLQQDLPQLCLLTFDKRLLTAANGEGLIN